MSSQQLSRSSSRSERKSVEMTEENKSESQTRTVPQDRQESNTTETADRKSERNQNADGKVKGKKCKSHRKRHGPRFMHHQPGFYGPRMFDTMGGQYNPWQTDDLGDEATDEYEQLYGYEQQDPTSFQEDNYEGAVGGEYAGPGPWHRFQQMGPMGEQGPNIMRGRGWWRRMMAEQNAMPWGQAGPMTGARGLSGFRGRMGMNKGGRRHGPRHDCHHHHHDEEEIIGDGETCADITPEGVLNTTDTSSSSDEDIEIITPECCEEETLLQNENVKKSEENTDKCTGRRKGPRRGPMGRCKRKVMRQCLAMGMLHPFMMKPWLADEDSSESDEKVDKSQNEEEANKPTPECKKMGKHFRRAMKHRMRMGMFHPFMLKPWMMIDSSSEEDSDVPAEGDSEPKKTEKWQKQKKCRRHAMRECMAMGMLPPGAGRPWMFKESSDSEDTSSDSAAEGCDTECKGKKRCCRKGRKGPRKMWRKMLKRQLRMNAMAGQMGPVMSHMGPRGRMMAGMCPRYGMSPMSGMDQSYGMGQQHGYGPTGGMHSMGPMSGMDQSYGMGQQHGYGPMGGMHSMGPMSGMDQSYGMGPHHGYGPTGGMHSMGPMRGMGPRHGFGPLAGMQKRCPMGGMGPRHGHGPMNPMGPRHGYGPMNPMGPRHGYGSMNPMGQGSMMSPWMSPFGMMRPKKFMKIMKKVHKENRKAEKESMQKDMNSLSDDFEKGMDMTEKKK